MNKLGLLYLLCVLLISLVSCSEDSLGLPDNYEWWLSKSSGSVSATINGDAWGENVLIQGRDHPSDSMSFDYPNIDIVMRLFNSVGYNRLEFSIDRIPCEIGSYQVVPFDQYDTNYPPTAFFVTILDGGDVVGDYYLVDSTMNNFVEISKITEDKWIQGKFELHFVKQERGTKLPSPDSVHLINGLFETQLLSQEDLN